MNVVSATDIEQFYHAKRIRNTNAYELITDRFKFFFSCFHSSMSTVNRFTVSRATTQMRADRAYIYCVDCVRRAVAGVTLYFHISCVIHSIARIIQTTIAMLYDKVKRNKFQT